MVGGTQKTILPARDELHSFPLGDLHDNSLTDFDLFLDVGGVVVYYAPAPYCWTKQEIARLQSDGHRQLLCRQSDQSKIAAYRRLSQVPKINETLPPPSRLLHLSDVAAEFTRVLFEYPFTESALHHGKQIAEAMVRCVEEDPTCVSALGKLAQHDHYTYYHSGRVSAYSIAIAMQLGMRDSYSLTELSLGCLLHDVGKGRIPQSLLLKAGPLTEQEWLTMRQHPIFGAEQVGTSLLTTVPREIILHHHERLDGTGYPHNLISSELVEEVKIASFADVFDALTTNRPYQQSRSRFEALDFLRFKHLQTLHQDSFRAMVEILGRIEAARIRKAG